MSISFNRTQQPYRYQTNRLKESGSSSYVSSSATKTEPKSTEKQEVSLSSLGGQALSGSNKPKQLKFADSSILVRLHGAVGNAARMAHESAVPTIYFLMDLLETISSNLGTFQQSSDVGANDISQGLKKMEGRINETIRYIIDTYLKDEQINMLRSEGVVPSGLLGPESYNQTQKNAQRNRGINLNGSVSSISAGSSAFINPFLTQKVGQGGNTVSGSQNQTNTQQQPKQAT